jgi:hypothetical protein
MNYVHLSFVGITLLWLSIASDCVCDGTNLVSTIAQWEGPVRMVIEQSLTPNEIVVLSEGRERSETRCLRVPYLFVPTIHGSVSLDDDTLRAWLDIAGVAHARFVEIAKLSPTARYVRSTIRTPGWGGRTLVDAVTLSSAFDVQGATTNIVELSIAEGWSVYVRQFGDAPQPFHSIYLEAERRACQERKGWWSKPHLIEEFQYLRIPKSTNSLGSVPGKGSVRNISPGSTRISPGSTRDN